MFKGDRGFSIFIVGLTIATILACFATVPKYPDIPTNAWLYDRDDQYFPGSATCTPSRLGRLSKSEAADEKYRCDLALEREKNRDLIQATRSADASVASVEISFRQTILAIIGAGFGIWTLIAAAFAAWYARSAANAARGTQDSYIEVERPNPIIGLDNFAFNEDSIRFDLVATNVGGTACVVVLFSGAWIANKEDHAPVYIGHTKVIPVPAGSTAIISNVYVYREDYKHRKIFKGSIIYISSLAGNETKKFMFNVFPTISSPYNQTHMDILSNDMIRKKVL